MNPVGQAPEPLSLSESIVSLLAAKRAGAVGSQGWERTLASGRIFTGLKGGLYEFTQPFNKYVSGTCYVPGNILGFSKIMRSKDRYIVPIMEITVLRGRGV